MISGKSLLLTVLYAHCCCYGHIKIYNCFYFIIRCSLELGVNKCQIPDVSKSLPWNTLLDVSVMTVHYEIKLFSHSFFFSVDSFSLSISRFLNGTLTITRNKWRGNQECLPNAYNSQKSVALKWCCAFTVCYRGQQKALSNRPLLMQDMFSFQEQMPFCT